MQYLDYKTNAQWQSLELTKYFLLVTSCLIIWFAPLTHNYCMWLDQKTFTILNSSLSYSHSWQLLWGYLVHPNESWINVLLMISINILGIFSLPAFKRPKALAGVVYFWMFFQVILWFTHTIFSNWIAVQRASPSLVITPWVVLSESLNMDSLKVSSSNCFPSGHVLVLIFWLQFTKMYSKSWIYTLAIATTVLLTLPRLFSGAHWLSDIVFTICYALLWFRIAIGTPLFTLATRYLEKMIILMLPKKKFIGDI